MRPPTSRTAAAGTISAWILGDNGRHRELWFSTADSVEEESRRAVHSSRPPYQLYKSLPAGSVIHDAEADLGQDEIPWNGPDYFVEDYSYGYSDAYNYSNYSDYSESY